MPLPVTVRRLQLDDPSHLAEMIGDAHVVAIGENNHHIGEVTLLRGRILRFLVTERVAMSDSARIARALMVRRVGEDKNRITQYGADIRTPILANASGARRRYQRWPRRVRSGAFGASSCL